MDIDLTRISREALDLIVSKRMTATEAAEYLRQRDVVIRSFGETLCLMCTSNNTEHTDDTNRALEADIVRRLRDFYLALDPSSNPRGVTKKLQNWMKDRNLPQRSEIFKVAFALELTEEELSYLLALSDGYGIQYRDGKELVLAWFLRNGHTYNEAVAFWESLPSFEQNNVLSSEAHATLTHKIEDDSYVAHTEADLRDYYLQNITSFGTQHLRAHYYFDRYLSQLIQPTPLPGEKPVEPYSLETVMNTYLTLGMRADKRRRNLLLVQKLIKKNWPNATAIDNMKNQVIDIPRKVLLLLYVATENLGFDDDYDFFEEEEESLEDRVSDHWVVLNAILADCGMAQLDLRNAFDWLIMYAIAVDDDEAMSERLEAVIEALYDSI